MPKFITQREKNLFNRVQNELLKNIVPVTVKYIKRADVEDAENPNPYAETRNAPVRMLETSISVDILALIRLVDPQIIEELTGIRYQRTIEVWITREEMEKYNLGEPRIGDYIYYWNEN